MKSECMKALKDQDYPNYELLCISEGTEAEAQNAGIRRAAGEIVMFTNSDVYVPRDWISRHVKRLSQGYDMVGGGIFWSGDIYALAWNQRPRDTQLGFGFSNASIRRDYVVGRGGIPLLPSFQDGAFVFSALKDGGRMLIDRSIVAVHDHPFKSMQGCFRRAYNYERGLFIILRLLYGRAVGQTPIRPRFATNQIREWLCIEGVRVWKERRIRANLLRFLFIRLFAFRLGSLCGILTSPRHPTWSDVVTAH
jgi:hypothetical protein